MPPRLPHRSAPQRDGLDAEGVDPCRAAVAARGGGAPESGLIAIAMTGTTRRGSRLCHCWSRRRPASHARGSGPRVAQTCWKRGAQSRTPLGAAQRLRTRCGYAKGDAAIACYDSGRRQTARPFGAVAVEVHDFGPQAALLSDRPGFVCRVGWSRVRPARPRSLADRRPTDASRPRPTRLCARA